GRDDHEFGSGARAMLADDPEEVAERFLSLPARGARAAGEARIYHDPLARPHRRHGGSDRVDHSRTIRPRDVRKDVAHARQAVGDEEVEAIERGGVDADPRVARRLEL